MLKTGAGGREKGMSDFVQAVSGRQVDTHFGLGFEVMKKAGGNFTGVGHFGVGGAVGLADLEVCVCVCVCVGGCVGVLLINTAAGITYTSPQTPKHTRARLQSGIAIGITTNQISLEAGPARDLLALIMERFSVAPFVF